MLTDEDVDRFKTEGYLVVENVIDPATLQDVRDEYAELLDTLYLRWHAEGLVTEPVPGMTFWEKLSAANASGFDWYQALDISLPHADITDDTPMHFGPAVFNMVTHTNILDIAEAIIGPEITSNPIQHVRIKPPQQQVSKDEIRAHIVSTDWHQDRGVTLKSADQTDMVTIWLAITDATIENGCLQVMPGAEAEMLPHCTLKQTGITAKHLPKREAVPTPVKAGGAVIFHPLTPHASLSNNSDGYRWSFDLRFSVTGQPTGRDHFPSFIARSKNAPERELKDWTLWKAMWEDARHRAASTTHIPQHRWPSDGPNCA